MPTDFMQDYDDTGACSEDEKICEQKTTKIESALVFDSSKTDVKVFPLRLAVTGKNNGKTIKQKVWTIPFDTKKWTYFMPANWILKDKAQ